MPASTPRNLTQIMDGVELSGLLQVRVFSVMSVRQSKIWLTSLLGYQKESLAEVLTMFLLGPLIQSTSKDSQKLPVYDLVLFLTQHSAGSISAW